MTRSFPEKLLAHHHWQGIYLTGTMSIKQNITIAFTLIVATILALFSVFVYYSYEELQSGTDAGKARCQGGGYANECSVIRKHSKRIFSFLLTEQYEGVYDQHNNLVVATSQTSDYIPNAAFLRINKVKKET